jgi:hypothetical protein
MDFLSGIQWDELGIGVAALVCLIVIVRIMRGQTDKLLAHTEETTTKVLDFFGNHMSDSVKQQAETTNAIRGLTDAVRELKDETRRSREEKV